MVLGGILVRTRWLLIVLILQISGSAKNDCRYFREYCLRKSELLRLKGKEVTEFDVLTKRGRRYVKGKGRSGEG
jgi:hypothetical protein